jgi:hypothetical protein
VLNRRDLLFWPLARFLVGPGDPRDDWFWEAARSRARPVFLIGDSIARGLGLGQWADQTATTHPLYRFRSIAAMADLVLEENGRYERIGYTGIPVNDPKAPSSIRRLAEDGIIRPSDTVVIEDAGDFPGDALAYLDRLLACLAALPDGTRRVLMTMFDYTPNTLFQFDLKDATGLSRNDAIRDAAEETGATLIDMNAIMDARRVYQMGHTGVDVVLPDLYHANVWGQMLMTGEILKAVGLRDRIVSVESAASLATVNWDFLRYGSPYWTAATGPAFAQNYARDCLLR